MKKIYSLLFAMLCTYTIFAATCITTQRVFVNYKTQMVTFRMTWNACDNSMHLNKAWVFVDYQPIDANGNKGNWTHATISGTPSVTNGTYTAGNTNGFYVTGANGQSATITVKLGNLPTGGRYNWCAIAIDYPPVALFTTTTNVLFKGTPPFVVKYDDGSSGTIANTGKTNYTPTADKAITSVTDATTCPGLIASVTTNAVTGANNSGSCNSIYRLNGANTSVSVSERGFVYSTTQTMPTMSDTKIPVSAGVGSMSYNWQNYTYSTTFYVRAYAISRGTVMYGNVVSYKTWSNWAPYNYYSSNYGCQINLNPCYFGWYPSYENSGTICCWACGSSYPANTATFDICDGSQGCGWGACQGTCEGGNYTFPGSPCFNLRWYRTR